MARDAEASCAWVMQANEANMITLVTATNLLVNVMGKPLEMSGSVLCIIRNKPQLLLGILRLDALFEEMTDQQRCDG
jgi:hypothetical protein